ncbi:autotransporter secretion inner membrane protein TamB [Cognatiyoonia koreensis]|uniref:Autotransporter secretion inner membrane protein TamB n=1 Tax=Cognatiyoonia koreensis TaxID=364200 RepID=A0A1I0MVT2_9RHOB|nr:translocation/assembly module TamB domain-containing protein [Cognatiyoonia koreensis]SEV92534.1 autotransporter secretion inner membrane protein TamB [Cognatiyoonia koreensis]
MRHFAAIAALLLLPFAAHAQSQEDEDKGYLTNLIEDNLSGDTREVNIIGFAGALSSEATIERLTVADSQGIWLTLEDVTLDWNRSALLRGAIDVQELSAAKITVARAPLPDDSIELPDAEATPFALPELPVSIELDELRIEEISLGESFLGEPVTLSLTGTAQLADGAGSANVEAVRLDDRQGRFAIVGSYDNTSQVLELDLDLNEGPAGIIARLIDLPGRPAVDLSLTGTGPITDYAATLTLATDGSERLAGDITLRETETGQVFDLDVGGDITPLFAPEYQDFFGPDVQLAVTGSANASGGFNLSDLTLSAQKIRLQGEVVTDETGWPTLIDLTGEVADQPGEIVLLPLAGPKTYVERVGLNVAYDRSQSDDWTASFRIAGLERPGLRIDTTDLQGGGTLLVGDMPSVTANFTYGARGVELDDAGTAEAVGDAITGEAQISYQAGSPTEISKITLNGSGISLLAEATIAGPDMGLRTESNIALSVTTLGRFSTLAGRDLGGAADLSLISTISPLDGFFEVLLSGTTSDLEIGIPEVDAIIAGNGTISMLAERDTQGTRLRALRVATDAGEITADANLTSNGSEAAFNVALNDVAIVLDGISGPARLTGTIDQPANAPILFDVTGNAPSAQLRANGTLTTDETPQIIATIGVTATSLATYRPLIGDAYAGAVSLTIDVNGAADASQIDVTLDGQTRSLQTGIVQLDPLLRGLGQVSADLSRTGPESFTLNALSVETPQASIQGTASGELSGALSANADLVINDAGLIAPGLSGPLSATVDVDRDAAENTAVVLDATGPGTNISVNANIAPNLQIRGNAKAQIANLRPYQNLIGQPVSGGIDAVVVGTLMPDLSQFNTEITLRTQDIGIGNPSVDQLLRGSGTANANISRGENGLNVRNLRAETNNISLSATLNATDAGGTGQFDARLRDIGLFTDQLSGPVTASGTASRNGTTWGIDASATGPGGIGADINGTANDNGTLNINVNGNAPLGLANEIIAPRRLSGQADFALNVNGPPQLSSLGGRINVNGARLAAPTLAQAIENINGFVSIAGSQATVDVTGDVERGGQLSISGPIGLTQPQNADVTVTLRDVILKDPTLYESSIAGAIAIRGPLAGGARISGDLTLGPSEIQVPSSSLSSLGSLPDVRHVGESAAVRRTLNRADVNAAAGTTNPRTTSGPDFPLDITINAPSRIFIRGRGLDAELGGSLNLGGTVGNVVPVGQFDLIRGRIDILQQRFELSEGTASLQGDFEPYIRLVATTEAATGTVINIIVEGPASEPEVTFSSTPELPQDEVLAQLIFGRDLSEISPLQAVQLAAAVSTLAGNGGGGLIDDFRQNIGLDDFDVTTDDEGNAAVRAGAYVSENVYTDVTVSSDGSTEVNINLDITDEITAKGTVDADGETSIGIFFERDY